jgi:NitT/TauT family transport system substrate-binding protein
MLTDIIKIINIYHKKKGERSMKNWLRVVSIWLVLVVFTSSTYAEKIVLRVGHFSNITHAQGIIVHQLSRQGQGWFEQRLGQDVTIEWYVYNAGPSTMEAIFAKTLDLTYVGPNPAINAYVKSNSEEIRIIAGSANGGAALVVQGDGMC